ncbi:hypothetical protein [Pedobacter sp. JY14-1]|uniref:lipopolysaccharide biosynthesis protein n=1 Tax=Pedobacter sp. JY14-1 TaxID=3034151 RepID=UPI0023E3032E|nr:hypothetical protein [Pedobacter sp. JY14-1]
MTWLSYSTRALSLFAVLPLVLRKFAPGDIVLWYLFSTIISLQNLADLGFRQTFSRVISFAYGGAKDIGTFVNKKSTEILSEEPNIPLLTELVSTMQVIYTWLTILVLILGSSFGTWAMAGPIKNASSTGQSWMSWGVVLLVSCISFYGKIYLNFLEGLYKIALVRRVETITSVGSILSSLLVLIISPSLLNLVLVNQFWALLVTFRDWYLCKRVNNGFFNLVSVSRPFNRTIFNKIWPQAWRSGISNFMSVGLTNLSGLVYAQVGGASAVASYLLAIRIINQIKDISMAPFYSKLPILARLRVSNDLSTLIRTVKRGMFISHIVYVLGFIFVGVFSDFILSTIHSEVPFVSQPLWMLIGLAFFIHRYGAMHMQVYLSTNHVISHIADGVSGLLYIISALLLSKLIGVYAIPVGLLIGYLGFYSWYATIHSIKSLDVNFWDFEKRASLIPVTLMILYLVFYLKFL